MAVAYIFTERQRKLEEAKYIVKYYNGPDPGTFHDELGRYLPRINGHLCYRYQILRLIGTGSSSSVVKAYDHQRNRFIAIKIFIFGDKYKKIAARESFLTQILQENSEGENYHVIKYLSRFEFRFHACIAFGLLKNTLTQFIASRPRLTIYKIHEILTDILTGLKSIHSAEIIHGDLNPTNIGYLNKRLQKTFTIMDFGTAFKEIDSNKQAIPNQLISYRAPEVILRAQLDTKVDIWCLGLIGAELFLQRPLFTGLNERLQMRNYISCFGYPSEALINRSDKGSLFFIKKEDKIAYIMSAYDHPYSTPLEVKLGVAENYPGFMSFLKKCLQMDPEDRKSAEELLKHNWML